MKTPRSFTFVLSLSAVAALTVSIVNSAGAGSAPAAKPADAEPVIPKSVFTIPNTAGVARDPEEQDGTEQ